jgi:diaminohydroxyphosphoribosylaminopyrimidine deaminase/5-amino-6-(5-phosphoribosylamino)uracil reductase
MYSHEDYMRIAIECGLQGIGRTFPNPTVGCVIVKNGQIIGKARTADGGSPHAEPQALKQVGKEAKGSEIYVSLEPCGHQGKNPPCVDAIIAAKPKKIYIANKDISSKVNGAGIKKLQEAGIEAETGILKNQAIRANLPFFSNIKRNRPYITLKCAITMDGKIALANGKSKWISGEVARRYSQLLRLRHDAILVGNKTILNDNPSLDLRLKGLEEFSPQKIILDQELKILSENENLKILQNSPEKTHIFTDKSSNKVRVINGRSLNDLTKGLSELGVQKLLIEGGARTITEFLKARLIDENSTY